MPFKRFCIYICIFVLLSLCGIQGQRNVWAIGLSNDYPRMHDEWFPRTYLGDQSIRAFIEGYNFSDIPGEFQLIPPQSIFLVQSDPLLDRNYTETMASMNQKGLLDQIKSDSGSILAMAVGTIAFLYVMPESFSKWPQEKKDLSPNKLWERYDDNVSDGPVWDGDKWEVNYIGHPYFGAAYYTHAMNKNFTRLESLSYSFMMSTCLYEYGLEAFFEDPSIQDLFVTPVVGSCFGEAFMAMSDNIHTNGDRVLGSKSLGAVCLFMLDPITATLAPINTFNERYSKLRMEAHYYSRSTISDDPSNASTFYDHRVGVEISITTDAFFR
jgi:hypothetical protein